MRQVDKRRGRRTVEPAVRPRLALLVVGLLIAAAAPALAQSWWPPWGSPPAERGPPIPREPVYRDPPQQPDPSLPPDVGYPEGNQQGGYPQDSQQGYPPRGQQGNPQTAPQSYPPAQQGQAAGGWSGRNSICLQLEQRLAQEGQKNTQSRDRIPALEGELRQVEAAYQNGESQLERMDCYDYFLFAKSLRRTRRCIDQSNQVNAARERMNQLEAQLQQIASSSGRSYQDDIVRELARNNCGASYEQQARRQGGFNPFSSMWEEEDAAGGGLGPYSNVPYATYRTVCVRLCDGYFFPISFSTLPNHFQRDADACQSKCAAPAELYYYQNPGATVEQAMAARSNEPYTSLKSAFRYRKEYVPGCSCKVAEYLPDAKDGQQQGAVQPGDAGPDAKRADAPPGELPWQPQ